MRKLLFTIIGAASVAGLGALIGSSRLNAASPEDFLAEYDTVCVVEEEYDTVCVVEEVEAEEPYDSVYYDDIALVDSVAVPEEYGPTTMEEWKEFYKLMVKAYPELQMSQSGLIYMISDPGNGTRPTPMSTIVANYEGQHLSGEVFDSYFYDGSGTPLQFPLNRVIPAWTEAAQMIGEGGQIFIVAPYWLAYGETGAGGVIEPYEPLLFNIELIKVK